MVKEIIALLHYSKKEIWLSSLYLNLRVGCLRVYAPILLQLVNVFLKAGPILDYPFKSETGTANQGNIGLNAVQNTLFPLPPLNEQKRIAAKVDELMRLCDELEEQIRQSKEESERLVLAVLREAFEGKYSEGPEQEVSAA